jgi:hypothetical protein
MKEAILHDKFGNELFFGDWIKLTDPTRIFVGQIASKSVHDFYAEDTELKTQFFFYDADISRITKMSDAELLIHRLET